MGRKILAPLLAALVLVGSLAMLTACNTIEGAGKDIEHGGREIKEEAREHN